MAAASSQRLDSEIGVLQSLLSKESVELLNTRCPADQVLLASANARLALAKVPEASLIVYRGSLGDARMDIRHQDILTIAPCLLSVLCRWQHANLQLTFINKGPSFDHSEFAGPILGHQVVVKEGCLGQNHAGQYQRGPICS